MFQIKRKSSQTIKMSFFRESPYLSFFLQKNSRKQISSTSFNVNFIFISRHNIYNIIMELRVFSIMLKFSEFLNFWSRNKWNASFRVEIFRLQRQSSLTGRSYLTETCRSFPKILVFSPTLLASNENFDRNANGSLLIGFFILIKQCRSTFS